MSAAGPGEGGGTAPFFSTHYFKKPPKSALAYQQKLEGRHQAPPPRFLLNLEKQPGLNNNKNFLV